MWFRHPTQCLEAFQIGLDLMLAVEAVVKVCPQVAVWGVVLEQMPDYCEDGMGHSNGGAVFAPSGSNALILCLKIRIFHFYSCFRALGQHGF